MTAAILENSPEIWLRYFPFPKSDGHKYDRGHALIGGGAIMTGATRLAARAAQRIGAGLVTLAAPKAAYTLYAESLESVLVREVSDLGDWRELLNDPKRNVILIGPGLGIGADQAQYVLEALTTKKPCILDADALTNFAEHPEKLFSKLHAQCVLTPHEGEFKRLFGKQIDIKMDKEDRAQRAAELAGCVVLLKGHETMIVEPKGEILKNTNAPAWLATAGAGDVLAGIILGLMAQLMSPLKAAAAAAWIHGKCAEDFGLGLIAEDLITGIPAVLRGLSEAAKRE